MVDIKSILVIDNELYTIESIKSCLEKEEFNVTPAYDRSSAIKLFYEISPSMVILDLALPDINGIDICHQIRTYSKVPIMIVSRKTDDISILEGFRAGADDYVTKPFSPRLLIARVNALFRRTEI